MCPHDPDPDEVRFLIFVTAGAAALMFIVNFLGRLA
jgi:hypothetical protein